MLSQKINNWITQYGYEILLCTSEQRNNKFIYAVDEKLGHIDLAINYSREAVSPKVMLITQNHLGDGSWVFVTNIIGDYIGTQYPSYNYVPSKQSTSKK